MCKDALQEKRHKDKRRHNVLVNFIVKKYYFFRKRQMSSTPVGLCVVPDGISIASQKTLWDYFMSDDIKWFQRFGKRFPKTAHFNGHHCMLEDPAHVDVLKPIVLEAMRNAQARCDHPILHKMIANPSEVAVATMKHEPGWGLGAHVDVYAPEGTGLVVMLTVANTHKVHRNFRFSQPVVDGATSKRFDVLTPSGTVVVFSGQAYDEWKHESVKNKKQDGVCISLTIRLREIDGYDGWEVPASVVADASRVNVSSKRYRSHGFAEEQMLARIKRRRRHEEQAS